MVHGWAEIWRFPPLALPFKARCVLIFISTLIIPSNESACRPYFTRECGTCSIWCAFSSRRHSLNAEECCLSTLLGLTVLLGWGSWGLHAGYLSAPEFIFWSLSLVCLASITDFPNGCFGNRNEVKWILKESRWYASSAEGDTDGSKDGTAYKLVSLSQNHLSNQICLGMLLISFRRISSVYLK